MTATCISTSKLSATLANKHWWLSLYPRLSTKGKRGLMVACLGGMMLAQSIGLMDSSTRSYSPYDNPAVQNALSQLGLDTRRDPIGDQFQVNSYTSAFQNRPAVAVDNDGDFVVVWQSAGSYGNDYGGYSIQGQRYDSAGIPQGSQFQVNSYTTYDQQLPAVAMDSDGDFVVVWRNENDSGYTTDPTIQGQRYNSAGVPQGGEFQVNSYTTGHQTDPAVAMDSDGDFVVAWASAGSSGSDTDGTSIQGQRYNAAGVPQGSQFQVNSYTTNDQYSPAVALDDEGNFVVVWESLGSSGTDTSQNSIQGQRYDSSGGPQGSQFQVNSYTTDQQRDPDVALDSDGDFLIAWQSKGSPGNDNGYYGDYSVQGQRYNSIGAAQGSQFQVNSLTTFYQGNPAVSLDNEGDFVVIWQSGVSGGDDTSLFSIQGQAYDAAGSAQGGQFQVNSYTTNDQSFPDVAQDNNGNFVVVWTSEGSDGTDTSVSSIQGQRYTAGSVGGEFQVNSYTTGFQNRPAVALDNDGDFVVVWQSNGSSGSDTDGYSIQGQRYNSAGVAQGSEFQVNSDTTSNQRYPAVSMDSDGDFVVVWQSIGNTYFSLSVQAQRYNSSGIPQGAQFQVNSNTTNDHFNPAVALDSDGDFVITWTSYSGCACGETRTIQGQRYNSLGVAQGSQFQVNTYITSHQQNSDVAADDDGDFVVVWHSNSGDNSGYSIQGQRFDSAGTPQGNQFLVNSYTTNHQKHPAVAIDNDGDFVVVWRSFGSGGGDTDGYSVQGQRFDSAGIPQGNQFQVNSYTTERQAEPSISLDSNGNFVVVWNSDGSSGDDSLTSIQSQRYNSAGIPQSGQFQVNSYTHAHQIQPAVALDSDGDFVVVWESYGSSSSDTDGFSIQAHQFDAEGPTPTPTPTATPTDTPTSSPTSTNTPTPSATPSNTATPTLTNTPTTAPPDTPTPTQTHTPAPTSTATPTSTAVPPGQSIYLPAVISDSSP